MSTKNLRPTYARIDLDRFASNINAVREQSNADIIAVVKADAYGHGMVRLAKHAYDTCNVKSFAVATIAEAMALREVLPSVRIIILGYVDRDFYQYVTDLNLHISIFDDEIARSYHEYLANKDLHAPIVLKIDTGMGRLGFPPNIDLIKRYPRFKIDHVMSHLATVDPEYTEFQESLFNFKGFETSLYASAGILMRNNTHPFVRPGIILYSSVMSIYSKIVHVQRLSKGQSVSYGRLFQADKECIVGVVPIGYADGYDRRLTNNGRMYVNGEYCPVIGTVCMDMTMIDLSAIGEGAYGMEVEIMGEHVTTAELAERCGTIDYEILCGISGRIPRVYE
ncbi:MAG: alanine racemase [Deferribacteraceae bacterium]|jgi:alanine racemase|nr:alanine racemase [Deferribacteraceae bacterium]